MLNKENLKMQIDSLREEVRFLTSQNTQKVNKIHHLEREIDQKDIEINEIVRAFNALLDHFGLEAKKDDYIIKEKSD